MSLIAPISWEATPEIRKFEVLKVNFSRRSFLSKGAVSLGSLAFSASLAAPALALSQPTISLQCLHTNRSCEIKNFDGTLSSQEADDFRSVARDWRANKVYGMDLNLVTILAGISKAAETEVTTGLISGYRTPHTNQILTGTAKHSLHMKGLAMDIRYPGLSTRELRDIAMSLRAGGVGYYPGKRGEFVHVDTGRVRYW
jgi:uncharacterized protein YcbK (DUF882 family)